MGPWSHGGGYAGPGRREHALRRDGDRLQPGRLGAPAQGRLRPPACGVGRREHGRHARAGRARRAARVRLHLGHRALRLRLFHAAESASVPRVLGGTHASGRCGNGGHRGPVVESRAAGQRDLHAGHPAQGAPPSPRDWAGISPHEYASLGYPIGESHAYFYDVIGALRASDGAERFTFDGKVYKIPPTTIRPQARHKGDLTTRIKAAFTTEASARMAAENGLGQMFVAGAGLDEMTAQVRRFNTIRASMGLPPDQPTTLLWMYCAETASEAEEGWEYFHNQLLAAQHHYFEWNNPGYAGIPGYEEYLKRQTADVGVADAGLAARRATQPIGTPDEIIEKIRTLQHAISLEMVVIHMFYGGMPRAKAEKSLRLFAEKVLPTVQAMPTPINPASLGQSKG